MVHRKLLVRCAIAAMAVAVGMAPLRAAQHAHGVSEAARPGAGRNVEKLKAGKRAEISLSRETRVGNLTLTPGRYRVQHRVDGSDHVLHFIELASGSPHWMSSVTTKGHAGDAPCEIESLPSKVRQTSAVTSTADGTARLLRVEIRGENVAHVL